jgi:glycosyltransferase involved in cell wall biosynthesis
VRVAFINHSTAALHLGGAERSLLQLATDWFARDESLTAHFITKFPPGLFVEELKTRGWSFTTEPFRGWIVPRDTRGRHGGARARDAASVGRIIETLQRFAPDIVVSNTLVAPWGAVAAKALALPHVWMIREFAEFEGDVDFIGGSEAAYADIAALSDLVVANSGALLDDLRRRLPQSELALAYPGIDLDGVIRSATTTVADDVFPGNPGLRITTVGRLSAEKDQWRVIDAIGELAARGVDASLCLVGAAVDPDYERSLVERAEARGVGGRVTFVGEQANPFPYVVAADVCVNPSTIETFGRTTLEAMALGRPVIAASLGAGSELVLDGVTGGIFDPNRTGDLADRLAEYAGNPERVRQHGEQAARQARDITLRHTNDELIARLENLAKNGTSHRLPRLVGHLLEAVVSPPQAPRGRARRAAGRLWRWAAHKLRPQGTSA